MVVVEGGGPVVDEEVGFEGGGRVARTATRARKDERGGENWWWSRHSGWACGIRHHI